MTDQHPDVTIITETLRERDTAKAEVARLDALLLSWRQQLAGVRKPRTAKANGKPVKRHRQTKAEKAAWKEAGEP